MIIRKTKNLINKYSEKRAVVLIIICTVAVLYVLFMVYFANPVPNLLYRNYTETDSALPFGYILQDNTVVQEFIFDQNATVHNIELQLANYTSIRHNINQVYIYLNNVLVHRELIYSPAVVDNAFYPLAAIGTHASKDDIMRIVITSRSGIPSEAITVWIRPDIVSENRLLRYNMTDGTYEELPGEISMRIFSLDSETLIQRLSGRHSDIPTAWISILFGGIMILTIISFFLLGKADDNNPSSDKNSQEGT